MDFLRLSRNVREWTNKVGEAMDEGLLDPRAVADMCLSYMSEDDVQDMCRVNDLKGYLASEEDEEEDAEV
jgi:hypothetical protein